jgi:hypothetical protein
VRSLYTNISVMLVLDFIKYTNTLIVASKGETGTYRTVCSKLFQEKHKYVGELCHSYFRAPQVYL